MKATLKRLISSSTTTIVLLLVYGAGLAIATFIEKYQGSEVVINVCLTLLYGLAVGFVVNETLSSRTILMLAFTAVVLSLACFVLRLWVSPLVAWNVVAFFIVAGLTVSSGMFEDAPMLYAVIPTTWVLNGVKFAGYVIPVGVVIAAISACLLFKAVKRV